MTLRKRWSPSPPRNSALATWPRSSDRGLFPRIEFHASTGGEDEIYFCDRVYGYPRDAGCRTILRIGIRLAGAADRDGGCGVSEQTRKIPTGVGADQEGS